MATAGEHPFRFNGALSISPIAPINGAVESFLERITGLDYLDRLYQEQPEVAPERFAQHVLDLLRVRCQFDERELERVPEKGGAVLVANHPFGAIEGVILTALLLRRRPDVKFMANYFLTRIPELRPYFIAVDPFGARDAARRNATPMREAVRHVRNGGLLVVFPAGEVSHLQIHRGVITDPPWRASVARLLQLAEAPVIPAFFSGANGIMFQSLGLIHPRLRTALLPREFINKRNRTIGLRVGEAIAWSNLAGFEEAQLSAYLRLRTYALGSPVKVAQPKEAPTQRLPAVEPPIEAELLARELEALPAAQCLDRSGALSVHYATAGQIPHLLNEIGRLREITFRQTGEGSGNACDLDSFDQYYRHLFLWNRETREVVGAYRLGLSDEILYRCDREGFYTHTLFEYRLSFLREITPAIELGRSFIRQEYQRSYSPLLLLWKGIGRFVAAHPRYRILFGPVSISNDYDPRSRRLMVDYLTAHHFLPHLAREVKPRHPLRRAGKDHWRKEALLLKDLDALSDVISAIEPDRKGVPVLIRQYLKLGGRLLGFNVDPKFSNALDGLIMVDLCETDSRMLGRYMGLDGAAQFLQYHSSWRRLRA